MYLNSVSRLDSCSSVPTLALNVLFHLCTNSLCIFCNLSRANDTLQSNIMCEHRWYFCKKILTICICCSQHQTCRLLVAWIFKISRLILFMSYSYSSYILCLNVEDVCVIGECCCCSSIPCHQLYQLPVHGWLSISDFAGWSRALAGAFENHGRGRCM